MARTRRTGPRSVRGSSDRAMWRDASLKRPGHRSGSILLDCRNQPGRTALSLDRILLVWCKVCQDKSAGQDDSSGHAGGAKRRRWVYCGGAFQRDDCNLDLSGGRNPAFWCSRLLATCDCHTHRLCPVSPGVGAATARVSAHPGRPDRGRCRVFPCGGRSGGHGQPDRSRGGKPACLSNQHPRKRPLRYAPAEP